VQASRDGFLDPAGEPIQGTKRQVTIYAQACKNVSAGPSQGPAGGYVIGRGRGLVGGTPACRMVSRPGELEPGPAWRRSSKKPSMPSKINTQLKPILPAGVPLHRRCLACPQGCNHARSIAQSCWPTTTISPTQRCGGWSNAVLGAQSQAQLRTMSCSSAGAAGSLSAPTLASLRFSACPELRSYRVLARR